MVGAVRFELTTSWTRTKRASHATLRPGPKCGRTMLKRLHPCNGNLQYRPVYQRACVKSSSELRIVDCGLRIQTGSRSLPGTGSTLVA